MILLSLGLLAGEFHAPFRALTGKLALRGLDFAFSFGDYLWPSCLNLL